jgi:hypothetical protein
MAYKISDFTRPVAPDSDYPYGDVKDNPSGTEWNRVAANDMVQFFRRIADNAGITLNSLPDNVSNGFQFSQALNTLINAQASVFASSLNTPSGTYLGVVVSGCSVSTSGSDVTITPGYLFYDGKLVHCVGGTVTLSSGLNAFLSIGALDAMPTCTPVLLSSATIDNASRVRIANLVTLNSQNGFDSFTSSISTLNTQVSLGSWVNLSGSGQWAPGTITPRYTKDGEGRVNMSGQYKTLSGSLSTAIDTLPSGYRPTVDMTFPVAAYNATSSSFYTAYITITTSGTIVYETISILHLAANWYIDLSGIMFLTS